MDPEKRRAVGAQIDTYAMEFPDEFRWASSPLAPALLYRLFSTIDASCRPEPKSRSVPAKYLDDRKAYPQPDRFIVNLDKVGRQVAAEAEQLSDPPEPKTVDNEILLTQQARG